ncbi:hypothetical protein BD958_005281, partial [Escherichia coli]|nr:hypothetical protein [Escherichia coli]
MQEEFDCDVLGIPW